MKLTKEPSHVRWLIMATIWALATVFLYTHASKTIQYYEQTGKSGLRGTETSETPLQCIWPSFAMDAKTWVRYSLAASETDTLRLKYVDIDNAPDGRIVAWNPGWMTYMSVAGKIRAKFTGETLPIATERAAQWQNLPFFILFIVLFSTWVARRAGAGAGVFVVCAMIGIPSFYEGFLPAYPDHHGLSTVATFGVVLGGIFMGAGWWRAGKDGDPDGLLPQSQQSARRAAVFSGLCGAFGMWFTAAPALPPIAIVGVISFLASLMHGRSLCESGAKFDPMVWKLWGRVGAAASFFFFLLDNFPSHLLDFRMETNHPFYSLAWLGAGEIIAELLKYFNSDQAKENNYKLPRSLKAITDAGISIPRVLITLTVALAPLFLTLAIGGEKVFVVRDTFLAELHKKIAEFQHVWEHGRLANPYILGTLLMFSVVPVLTGINLIGYRRKQISPFISQLAVVVGLAALGGILIFGYWLPAVPSLQTSQENFPFLAALMGVPTALFLIALLLIGYFIPKIGRITTAVAVLLFTLGVAIGSSSVAGILACIVAAALLFVLILESTDIKAGFLASLNKIPLLAGSLAVLTVALAIIGYVGWPVTPSSVWIYYLLLLVINLQALAYGRPFIVYALSILAIFTLSMYATGGSLSAAMSIKEQDVFPYIPNFYYNLILMAALVLLAAATWNWEKVSDVLKKDKIFLTVTLVAVGIIVIMGTWQMRWILNASGPQICLMLIALCIFMIGTKMIWRWAVILCVIFLLFVPRAYLNIARLDHQIASRTMDKGDAAQCLYRDVARIVRATQPEGKIVMLAAPNASTEVGYYGRFQTIGTLYWENNDGLKAAARIYSQQDDREALRLIKEHGITHIVIISEENFIYPYFQLWHPTATMEDFQKSFGCKLFFLKQFPLWVKPIPYVTPPELKALDFQVAIFQIVPEQTPAQAYFNLGNYQRVVGQREEANRAFDTAIQADKNYIEPWVAKSEMAMDARNFAEARRFYDEAIKRTPAQEHPQNLNAIGFNFYQRGAYFEARDAYRDSLAIQFNPETAANYAWLLSTNSNPMFRDGKTALEMATKALEMAPNHPDCLLAYAAALAENERYDEALQSAQKALAILKQHAPNMTQRAEQVIQVLSKKEPIRESR